MRVQTWIPDARITFIVAILLCHVTLSLHGEAVSIKEQQSRFPAWLTKSFRWARGLRIEWISRRLTRAWNAAVPEAVREWFLGVWKAMDAEWVGEVLRSAWKLVLEDQRSPVARYLKSMGCVFKEQEIQDILDQVRDARKFDPKAVRKGEYWRFLTAPFIVTENIDLVASLIALFWIGSVLESAVSREQFVVTSAILFVVPQLLSFMLSTIYNYAHTVYGPCCLIIGLIMWHVRRNPNAVISAVGLTVPVGWIPWVLALLVQRRDGDLLMSAVIGLAVGWVVPGLFEAETPSEQLVDTVKPGAFRGERRTLDEPQKAIQCDYRRKGDLPRER
jgi:membrane associated rhomboid family serine protease